MTPSPLVQPSPPVPTAIAEEPALDLPEVWGQGSFPASDPPANW